MLVFYILTIGFYNFLLEQPCSKSIFVKNYTRQEYVTSVWVDDFNKYEFVGDTMREEITLGFEKGFNDSIVIFLNDKMITGAFLATNRNLEFAGQIKINYANLKKPLLYIISITNKTYVQIKLKKGYRIAYLERFNKLWYVEYSNYIRQYK